jgi:hypothetical protein
MDRIDGVSENQRSGGGFGSRQGQIKAAFQTCGAAGTLIAEAMSTPVALRHLCANQPEFSHP